MSLQKTVFSFCLLIIAAWWPNPTQARTCRDVLRGLVFRELTENEMYFLTRFAYTGDSFRSERDKLFWLQYKNGINSSPQTVDLGHSRLNSDWPIGMEDIMHEIPNFPLQYEAAVLSLKKGDTVHFGAQSFKLGEFLGSGNASHVFALVDQPGRVIKIPFLSALLANENRLSGLETQVEWGESHYPRILELNKVSFIALAKERKDLETNASYQFITMPRIHGTQLGSDFLNTVSQKLRGRNLKLGEVLFVNLSQLPDGMNKAMVKSLHELIQWMSSRGHATLMDHGVYALRTGVTRQLMLSDQGRWEVLDAE